MKAILKVHKDNQYSKYNGLTFEISNITHNGVELEINNVSTFFTFKEILIIDITEEFRNAAIYKAKNNDSTLFTKLEVYVHLNEMELLDFINNLYSTYR